MTNEKHTPGEWYSRRMILPPSEKDRRCGFVVNGPERDGLDLRICDLRVPQGMNGFSEGEANARLIAAAPCLLEVCREIAALADGQGQLNMTMVAGHARAAIAKATGAESGSLVGACPKYQECISLVDIDSERSERMKKASPGVRFADWINENEGSDLCFQGRARVAKKVNAMVKAEVMKERRKLLRVCEDFANELDVLRGDWIGSASKAVREVRTKMQNTRSG